MLAWQLLRFVNGHFRYCCRFGLIDNTLLGLAKPKQQKSHSKKAKTVGGNCISVQTNWLEKSYDESAVGEGRRGGIGRGLRSLLGIPAGGAPAEQA